MISTAERKKPLRTCWPTQGQRVSTGARPEQETSDSWSQLASAPILPERRPHQLPGRFLFYLQASPSIHVPELCLPDQELLPLLSLRQAFKCWKMSLDPNHDFGSSGHYFQPPRRLPRYCGSQIFTSIVSETQFPGTSLGVWGVV